MNKTSPWEPMLISEEIDDDTKKLLKTFFIADAIDFDQYFINREAFDNNGNYFEGITSGLNATASIGFASKPYNRGAEIHPWFIVAYPDVVLWMSTNKIFVDEAIKNANMNGSTPNLKFYRFFINNICRKEINWSVVFKILTIYYVCFFNAEHWLDIIKSQAGQKINT